MSTLDRDLSSGSRENLQTFVQSAIDAGESASDVVSVGWPMRHRGKGPVKIACHALFCSQAEIDKVDSLFFFFFFFFSSLSAYSSLFRLV